jgi:hypothetical protein
MKGAIEFTIVVAFWSFWAMLLNATRPGDNFLRVKGAEPAVIRVFMPYQ